MYYLTATDALVYFAALPKIIFFVFKILSINKYYRYAGLAWTLKYAKLSYLVLLPQLRNITLFKQRKYALSVAFWLLSKTYLTVTDSVTGAAVLSSIKRNRNLYPLRYYKIILKRLPLFSFLLYVLSLFTIYPLMLYTWSPLNARLYFYSAGAVYFYDSFVMRFLLT